MKLRGFVPNFPIYVYVRGLYIPTIGPPILLQQNRPNDRRSQIHECRNWEQERAVSFLGTFVSNFRYCVFAEQASILTFIPTLQLTQAL
jgi:hypothetical protein